jgi:hypothetical protein
MSKKVHGVAVTLLEVESLIKRRGKTFAIFRPHSSLAFRSSAQESRRSCPVVSAALQ